MQGDTLVSAFKLITSIKQTLIIIPSEKGQNECRGRTGLEQGTSCL